MAVTKDYVLQIKENVFIEKDPTKNCRNYPNPDFASYKDCDDQFMKDFVSTFDPPDMVPVWLAEDLDKVSSHADLVNFGELDLQVVCEPHSGNDSNIHYGDLWDGTQSSACPLPCTTTYMENIQTYIIFQKLT